MKPTNLPFDGKAAVTIHKIDDEIAVKNMRCAVYTRVSTEGQASKKESGG